MVELLSVVEVVVQPTLPTLLVHYIHTQAQNYMGPKAENTKQEATAKNTRGPLYTLIPTYLVYTLQPEGLGADTKSICMVREQPKNAVLCLVGYFKIMIMRLSYWKGNINFHTFTCNTSYQNCNQFSNKIGLVKKYRSCGPVGHVKYLAL